MIFDTNTHRHPLAAIGAGMAALAVGGVVTAVGIAPVADAATQASANVFSFVPDQPPPPGPPGRRTTGTSWALTPQQFRARYK